MAAAIGRPRHDRTLPGVILLALAATSIAACAADGDARRRAGPPGGGVDPSSITPDSLSMGGAATPGPEPVGDAPSTADPPSGAVDVPSPSQPSPFPQMGSTGSTPPAGLPSASRQPASPSPVPAGSAKPGATTFKMTAAHCAQIGRKVGQLTIAAGGDQAQADRIGNDFAAKCTRDQVGQVTEKRELDCILAMTAITDLPSCK